MPPAADTINASLEITAAIAANTTFNTKHIAAGLDEGFLDATALAEYLVRKSVPFRQAHGIVGSLVSQAKGLFNMGYASPGLDPGGEMGPPDLGLPEKMPAGIVLGAAVLVLYLVTR